MKKLVAGILAILYLTTSMGATIHFHYCMGKLVSWGLVDHESKYCMTCGMARKNSSSPGISKKDCCKDEHKLIRSDKDQMVASTDEPVFKGCPAALVAGSMLFPDIFLSSFAVVHPRTNAPPQWGQVPLFLRYGNFRI